MAVLVTPDLGDKFLGTQGDIWDTHWDMFLALLGAVITMALFGRWHDRQLGTEQKHPQITPITQIQDLDSNIEP